VGYNQGEKGRKEEVQIEAHDEEYSSDDNYEF